jgi:centractin
MSVPIVIDCGSGVIKAGFAGEDRPKALFHNVVGKPKHKRVMAGGALEGDIFVGSRVDAHRGALVVSHPMDHGRVEDWEGMYRVLSHVYDGPNLSLPPEDQPVSASQMEL